MGTVNEQDDRVSTSGGDIMETPDSYGFLDLLGQLDPVLVATIVIVLVAALLLRVRSGAALDPSHMWRHQADEREFGEVEPYTLEEIRRDYDPGQKWNRAPSNHDRL
jgi:hypothetical protein